MNKPTSIIVSIIVIVVALGFVFPSKSHAVSCGDVLGPFGIFKLNGDLNCIQSPALTVREAALLDLNGHAVRCAVPYGGVD